jgi:two-component system, cell cycle sensor histidine kinase and response regulator CckA
MGNSTYRVIIRSCKFTVSLVTLCLVFVTAAYARPDSTRKVLILNSYHKEFKWTDDQVSGAKKVLSEGIKDLELFVEYMDTKRIFNREYLEYLLNIYRLKYKKIKLDAIITTDDNALWFVVRHHKDVFDEAPVSFCGINDYKKILLEGKRQFTGLVEVLDIRPTIDLALKLHPGTRKIVVVVDSTPTGLGQIRDVASVARQYDNLEFEYLQGKDFTHTELFERLRSLPRDSIVLLTVWLRDKNNVYLSSDEGGRLISANATVPVYGIIDMYYGYGIVGGKILNSRTHGRIAAEKVLQIINGKKPVNLPVLSTSRNPYMFDSKQLVRWRIDASDLPKGSIFINRQISFYEQYKQLLWIVIGVFALLISTVAIFTINFFRRKQAEDALRESELKYKTLTENSLAGVFIHQDDKYVFVNEKFAEMHGYRPEELLGKPHYELIHPDQREAITERVYKRLSGEDVPKQYEIKRIKKSGEAVWHEIMVGHPTIYQGKPALLGHEIDINERKLAEKERENLINKLQKALAEVETLSAISKTVNQSLNLDQILNDALDRIMELFKPHSAHIRLLDIKTQELMLAAHKGLTVEDLKKLRKKIKLDTAISIHAIASHTAVVIEDILTDPYTAGKSSFCEKIGCRTLVTIPLFGKDKMLGHMSIRGREPSAFTAGEIQNFTSIGHQIGTAIENATLYQDMEITLKTLNETQDNLRQAQKLESIGTLAGGIAHDFNNILSPIMIHSEMAMMDLAPDSPVQHNLKEIFKSGERARDVVKQILAFSRKGKGERVAIKITPILKDALKMLRSSIPTTVDIQQNLTTESDTVFADPTQIHQIILNLGTNAAHAMRESGGILKVNLVQEDFDSNPSARYPGINPGAYLKLTVSDTGTGIDDETIQRIFEPYFTTKGPGEGTGMGLSLIHGIVKSYGGDITVKSEPGKGSTFNVYFPRIDADVSPVEKSSARLPGGTESILFVDDEKGMIDALKPMLEALGYKLTTRTSSIEALEVFRANPKGFDLLITDMSMPNMTGKDLAMEVMSIRRDIPVILCSGFSEQMDDTKTKEIGISAFIMKPIIIREMADTIRRVVDKNGTIEHT